MMPFSITSNYRKFFILSAVLLLVSVIALTAGGLNLGIDFSGGTIIQIDLKQTFEAEEVRPFTDKFDENADITYSGQEQQQLVVNTSVDLDEQQRQQLLDDLIEEYGIEQTDLLSIDTVSPSIGSELTNEALIAIGVAIIAMMAYITFRFEFLFGIAAVIALIHDVIIVLGVYALLNIQVNTPFIAAILTIVGYSINDSIVVFDRLRENKGKYKKKDLALYVDDSIRQTWRRSVNTSLTTVLALSALYFTGVPAIQDFTLPMIIGFLFGTYSSIFIAGSFWFIMKQKKTI
ncbi:MAG TPA: protein translocase subunit SecF [Eubacteriaceae bacterium]|nr:protein translocase subunit SecF [Eubacteriaceae bacterium]